MQTPSKISPMFGTVSSITSLPSQNCIKCIECDDIKIKNAKAPDGFPVLCAMHNKDQTNASLQGWVFMSQADYKWFALAHELGVISELSMYLEHMKLDRSKPRERSQSDSAVDRKSKKKSTKRCKVANYQPENENDLAQSMENMYLSDQDVPMMQ